MKFIFFNLFLYSLYFHELVAYVDISFWMIPFWDSVYITLPKIKFIFCQNSRNEITPEMSSTLGYFM